MSRALTKPQREKISQFCGITGASSRVATDCLQIADWKVEVAIDYFFSSGLNYADASNRSTQPRVDRAAIEQFFLQYKDEDNDAILVDGIVSLCSDLGVEPEDVVLLVLSFHLNAASMGEYTKEEWIEGMTKLRCENIDQLKQKLPSLRSELDDPAKFREIYNFAYMFGREKGQKCVQLDMALGLWQLLISEDKWEYIDDWCTFLKEEHGRAVSKDTWLQLLDFINNVDLQFSNYDEASAWPYLMDEFVHWKKKQLEGTGDGAA